MASVISIYARAFADAVLDSRAEPARTLQEAQAMSQLVAGSRELCAVWETPSIPAEQKRAVLDAIAAREKISAITRNFIAVLIDHGRIKFLNEIVKQFEVELDRRLGFAEAEIVSVRDLSDAERRDLESKVSTMTGKKVRARYLRDESILGGAVVKVGSTIYDGSVKGQLERIKQAMSS